MGTVLKKGDTLAIVQDWYPGGPELQLTFQGPLTAPEQVALNRIAKCEHVAGLMTQIMEAYRLVVREENYAKWPPYGLKLPADSAFTINNYGSQQEEKTVADKPVKKMSLLEQMLRNQLAMSKNHLLESISSVNYHATLAKASDKQKADRYAEVKDIERALKKLGFDK